MIPLTTLYDGYIDRPKLSDKKPIWVYSSSPSRGFWTIKSRNGITNYHLNSQSKELAGFLALFLCNIIIINNKWFSYQKLYLNCTLSTVYLYSVQTLFSVKSKLCGWAIYTFLYISIAEPREQMKTVLLRVEVENCHSCFVLGHLLLMLFSCCCF